MSTSPPLHVTRVVDPLLAPVVAVGVFPLFHHKQVHNQLQISQQQQQAYEKRSAAP